MKNDLIVKVNSIDEAKIIKYYAESKGLVYDEEFTPFSDHCLDWDYFIFNADSKWFQKGEHRKRGDFSLTGSSRPDMDTKYYSMVEIFRAIDKFVSYKFSSPVKDIKKALENSKVKQDFVMLSDDYLWVTKNNILYCYEKEDL